MKSMKIALTSTSFFGVPPEKYGGLEMIVWDLANGLTELGHKVVVFAPKGSQIPKNGFVYETGDPVSSVNVDWLKAEETMWNVCRDKYKDFDIIHSHDWFGYGYASKMENPNLKMCHTHHGGLNADWWLKSKPSFKLNFIAISQWMTKVYESQGMPSRYVYNGVDMDKYPFQDKKGDRLLFVGRLDSFKRPHIAIEVAKKLGIGLDIVGGSFVTDVAYMENIKRSADNTQIKLHLDASQEEKVQLYQNAMAVIFPSQMGEPFGLISAEGNSCGTPVIGSNDGAIPEVIENGVTGYICGTVDEMVEALRSIDKIKPINCRNRVEKLFSRRVMAENYAKLYQDILAGNEW